MFTKSRPIIQALISALLSLLIHVTLAQESSSDSLFSGDRVIDVRIEMSANEWAKLQPPKSARLDWIKTMMAFEEMLEDASAGGNFWKDGAVRPGLAGYLGVNHEYGVGVVTIDGERVENVGVRFKGNGTFMEGHPKGRQSFKLDFREFDSALKFRGLTKLNLNSNVTDPTVLREALSYELFREAGIKAARVGYAKVVLHVPTVFENQTLGIYTLIEQVDKRFLKDRYDDASGLLMKPSSFGIFRYLGEEWGPYEKAYVPKTDPSDDQQKRVKDFAKLVHEADEESFAARVEEYLDLDQFLKFVIINSFLVNLDSFLGGVQNHYVYLNPTSNKFEYLPWDMDHSFGSFPLEGSPAMRRNMTIHQPGGDRNILIERVLKIEAYRETYDALFREYLGSLFEREKLLKRIRNQAKFLKPYIDKNEPERRLRFDRLTSESPAEGGEQPLPYFVRERVRSVESQLNGKSTGDRLLGKQPKSFPIRAILIFSAFLGGILLIHLAIWIRGSVLGFKIGKAWGFANFCLYPIAPLLFGFKHHKEVGRRTAKAVLFGILLFLVWVGAAFVKFT